MSPRLRFRHPWLPAMLACGLLFVAGLVRAASDAPGDAAPAPAEKVPTLSEALNLPTIPNARCLKCHNDEDEKTSEREDGTIVDIYVDRERFEHSVHGKQPCVGCHNTVKKAIHETPLPKSIGCIACHLKSAELQYGSADPQYRRLDVVLSQIDG